MSIDPCLATIRGLPDVPSVVEVNVRSGPGTTYEILFKAPVGMSDMQILEVAPDHLNQAADGKTYQWFRLVFHGGGIGWVRDDLLEIQGECSLFGYGYVVARTAAGALVRNTPQSLAPSAVTADPKPESAAKPVETALDTAKVVDSAPDLERVKRASFAITAAFEGTGYMAYNNYDAGIISYGLIQFTLASGSLFTVIDKYLAAATSKTAADLQAGYYNRIRDRDPDLRHDVQLKDLLLMAAQEPEMQRAQDEVATVNYWDKVVAGYIAPRDLKTPLAYALLFDMGVNFGTGHKFVRMSEEQLGVPLRSKPGENGITEQQLITRVAELRRDSHYKQAQRDNLPGLKVRGDFWVDLVARGDWSLQGDSDGTVSVNGRRIQVRQP